MSSVCKIIVMDLELEAFRNKSSKALQLGTLALTVTAPVGRVASEHGLESAVVGEAIPSCHYA